MDENNLREGLISVVSTLLSYTVSVSIVGNLESTVSFVYLPLYSLSGSLLVSSKAVLRLGVVMDEVVSIAGSS